MAAKRLGKNRELTSREKSILEFIRQKIYEDGFPLLSVKSARQSTFVPLLLFMDIWLVWKSWALLREILPAQEPLRW